jgi:hypothetical protein
MQKTVFDGDSFERRSSVELYREGKNCFFINVNVWTPIDRDPHQLTAILYRHPRVRKQDGFLLPNQDIDPEKRRDNHAMLVHNSKFMEGSKRVALPSIVWLYLRFKYVDSIRGELSLPSSSRALTNGVFKMSENAASWKVDSIIRFSSVTHQDAHRNVEPIAKIVDNVADYRRKGVMPKQVRSSATNVC